MPVVSQPHELLESDVYVNLLEQFGRDLHLKCEGFNFAGSVKLRTAASLVESLERAGKLNPDSVLVESSSGNLGIAVAVIAASKGLRFVCVTDPRCSPSTVRLIRALGSQVVTVDRRDDNGGYLGSRIAHVRSMCEEDDRYLWLNQYENPANWMAHYDITAPEICKQFPDLDVLFVGAGTCGTLMGCAKYLRDNGSRVKVVAVDAQGSVTFGGAPQRRLIPGLGASVTPPLYEGGLVDETVSVSEVDTIRTCRALAGHGLLFGGSTGTVVHAALQWLERHDSGRTLRSAAIAPDLGERYLATIYDDEWVRSHYGAQALRTDDHLLSPHAARTAGHRSTGG